MRRLHYAYRTEQSYVKWVKRFILFQKERFDKYKPHQELGASDIETFITHLAV